MKLLFICTHNRCRSIICEAITNHLSCGRIRAYSAGSQPAGKIHPLTLEHLKAQGIDTRHLKSQSWNDLESTEFDAVITVCDSAASESCPIWWREKSIKIHWGLPDPSKTTLNSAQSYQGFTDLIDMVNSRIKLLLAQNAEQISLDVLSYIFQPAYLDINLPKEII